MARSLAVATAVLLALLGCAHSFVCSGRSSRGSAARRLSTLYMGDRRGMIAKGDIDKAAILQEFERIQEAEKLKAKEKDSAAVTKPSVEKLKLEPETTFFEGGPSWTEVVGPAISVVTIIGIIPFISAVARQAWVKYKFTSRRITINSGFGGKDETQVVYPDIEKINFAYRSFGTAGDMVMFLRDGAKIEMRFVPNFKEVYDYILSKCDDDCKANSMQIK